MAVEYAVGVFFALDGARQVEHQAVELVRLARDGHGDLELDGGAFALRRFGG